MALLADYAIIADQWVVERIEDTINFEVPGNIDKGSRSVLGFMLEVRNLDDLGISVRLNGTKVWEWKYGDGKRIQFFQEVIEAGVAHAGTNVFSFETSSGDVRLTKLSDIVLWFQANV